MRSIIGRVMWLSGIMVAAWLLMLLALLIVEKTITPIPPLLPGWWGSLLTAALKVGLASALAAVWLTTWHRLAKLYRRKMLRRLSQSS